MIAHKHITKIIAVVMAVAVCLCLCAVAFSRQIKAAAGDTGISMEYETALFDTDSVISVNILMDDADWNAMLENSTAEEYYQCDVEINGTTSAAFSTFAFILEIILAFTVCLTAFFSSSVRS